MDYLLPWATTVMYIYIGYRGPYQITQMKPKAWQEIEFLLLWATTESNMADILNLEENPTECIPETTGNGSPCCQGQQLDSKWLTKHEIQGNALRAHLRQEVEFSPAHGYYLRGSINLMKQNKQIRKQIQWPQICLHYRPIQMKHRSIYIYI